MRVCVCVCVPACRDPFSFPLPAGLTSAGERAQSSSTAVASGLLVGGFAVTWACTTFTVGVKVPPNVQRNIEWKTGSAKKEATTSVSGPALLSAGPVIWRRLGRAWIWTGPNWNQIAQADRPTKQQHSINLGRPGLDKLTTDNSNRDPFLFALAFSKFGHILSITNSSVHPPTHHPTARVSGFFSSQGTDQANSVHTSSITTRSHTRSLYTTLFAAACPSPRLLSTLISLLVHRYCVGPSSSSFPPPPPSIACCAARRSGVSRGVSATIHRRHAWVFGCALCSAL